VKRIHTGIIVAAALLASPAYGQSTGNLSYSYIEGGLSVLNIDDSFVDETELGFNIRGSVDLQHNVYLHGSWDRWDVDIGRFDLDTDLFKFGIGYRTELSQTTHLFYEGSWTRIEVGSASDDAFRADIGLRHGFSPNVEGRVFGGYATDFSGGDAVLGADALFKVSRSVGVSVGVETFEFDLNIFRVNLRLSF